MFVISRKMVLGCYILKTRCVQTSEAYHCIYISHRLVSQFIAVTTLLAKQDNLHADRPEVKGQRYKVVPSLVSLLYPNRDTPRLAPTFHGIHPRPARAYGNRCRPGSMQLVYQHDIYTTTYP